MIRTQVLQRSEASQSSEFLSTMG